MGVCPGLWRGALSLVERFLMAQVQGRCQTKNGQEVSCEMEKRSPGLPSHIRGPQTTAAGSDGPEPPPEAAFGWEPAILGPQNDTDSGNECSSPRGHVALQSCHPVRSGCSGRGPSHGELGHGCSSQSPPDLAFAPQGCPHSISLSLSRLNWDLKAGQSACETFPAVLEIPASPGPWLEKGL